MADASVSIIGGGASGVLLAAHLLAQGPSGLRVVLIEKTGRIGQGLAYSAQHRDHRVNVPARGMSAFADRPEDFLDWLRGQPETKHADDWIFVPRLTYGRYLESVLETAQRESRGRLDIMEAEVERVRETPEGVVVELADGQVIASSRVVLAVGHETQPARGRGIAVRLGSAEDTPLDPEARVMVLGSGLSMVDAWISLAEADHRGPILVVSRNGLLPKGHVDVPPIEIAEGELPFGAGPGPMLRWFRRRVAEIEAAGGNWRSVVDGLRPYNQRLWQSWNRVQRRRFLRHARPFWNIHRHRLPPDLHQRLQAAIAAGQVQLIAAEFIGAERSDGKVVARIRPRAGSDTRDIAVERVYDCGGVTVDVLASSNPVLVELVARGVARPDALRIGLDVTDDCAIINAEGEVSDRMFAIGPLTRGQFFEIEAIPDIRRQAAELAGRLIAMMAPGTR